MWSVVSLTRESTRIAIEEGRGDDLASRVTARLTGF